MKVLALFQRDLRLTDNLMLQATLGEKSLVCGIKEQDLTDWGEAKRQTYQNALGELAKNLKSLGHNLYYIKDLNSFDRIYVSKTYNTREQLSELSCEVIEIDQLTLFPLDELPFDLPNLPKTFTPFRHKMDKVKKIPRKPKRIEKLPLPEKYDGDTVEIGEAIGEARALERLEYYFKEDFALSYFDTRNGMVEYDDSTKFSPYLAWGTISANQIYWHLKEFESKRGENKSTYWIYFELLWRDYFKFLSLKYGERIFNLDGTASRELDYLQGEEEEKVFASWCTGETKEDFVNANMKELNQTGWMSNRGRQNVGSYLTKTLGVSWLKGAKYFEDHLIDFDVESNYGNWAYLAGVGVDPRDRIFNISRQASIYDPDGNYVNKWK